MSEKFVASNGLELDFAPEGHILIPTITTGLGEFTQQALREYFLHEQGVWVDAGTGALVVRLEKHDDGDGRAIAIIYEGDFRMRWERIDDTLHDLVWGEIRDRYFAAHPKVQPWMAVENGVYAVSPRVHPYERLLQFRGGEWLHLYRGPGEAAAEPHTAEQIAESAYKEGRLTRLVPESSND